MEKLMEKFQALSLGEKIILVAGVVLLIASFLPWYRVSAFGFTFSANGWQAPGALWSMLAVFIGLAMAGVVGAKTFTDIQLPANLGGQSWARVHLAGGVLALLLVVIKFINENNSMSFGFYLGFLCAIALAAGGALMFRDEGGTIPGMPSSDGPAGSPPGQ